MSIENIAEQLEIAKHQFNEGAAVLQATEEHRNAIGSFAAHAQLVKEGLAGGLQEAKRNIATVKGGAENALSSYSAGLETFTAATKSSSNADTSAVRWAAKTCIGILDETGPAETSAEGFACWDEGISEAAAALNMLAAALDKITHGSALTDGCFKPVIGAGPYITGNITEYEKNTLRSA
jgi:phage-related protein